MTEVRGQLEQRVSVTDDLWQLLVDLGFVGEVEDGRVGIDYLVEWVRRLRQATRTAPAREPVGELVSADDLARRAATRAEALAFLFAQDADEQRAVIDFRRTVLRGRLIRPARLEAWVRRREAKAGEAATTCVLSYAIPDTAWEQHARIAPGSELDRLRAVSDGLAARYGWEPAQASTFVVCGLVPLVAPVRTRFQRRMPVLAASRILLDVDPTATPAEVADRYKRTRARVLTRRHRRISEKNLRLAVYAQAHQEGTWEARMRGWNRLHPGDRRSQASNFQRDAAVAIRRLLDPGLR